MVHSSRLRPSVIDPSLAQLEDTIVQLLKEYESRQRHPSKSYRINLVGYGTIGQQLAFQLTDFACDPESNIESIHIWRPQHSPSDTAIQHEHIQKNISAHSLQDPTAPQRAYHTFHFHDVASLEDLAEITRDPVDAEHGSVTLLLTRYTWIDALVDLKSMQPRTLQEIERYSRSRTNLPELNRTRVFESIRATFSGISRDDDGGALEMVPRIQKDRLRLEALLARVKDKYQLKNDKRFDMLGSNLLGIINAGTVLRGYNGTILNLVNDVENSTRALLAASQLPYDRVWAPTDNDYTRAIHDTMRAYVEQVGSAHGTTIEIKHLFGDHGPMISLSPETMLINGQPLSDHFGLQTPLIFQSIKDQVTSFGMAYARAEGRPASDSVICLRSLLQTILNEDSTLLHRGSAYVPDLDVTTGIRFFIDRATIQNPLGLEYDPGSIPNANARENFELWADVLASTRDSLEDERFIAKYAPTKTALPSPKPRDVTRAPTILDKINGSMEEIKTRLDSVSDAASSRRHHSPALFFRVSPSDLASLERLDLSTTPFASASIALPGTDRYTAITGIRPQETGLAMLLSHNKDGTSGYRLVDLDLSSSHAAERMAFRSAQVQDFDVAQGTLYLLTAENGSTFLRTLRAADSHAKDLINARDRQYLRLCLLATGVAGSQSVQYLALRDTKEVCIYTTRGTKIAEYPTDGGLSLSATRQGDPIIAYADQDHAVLRSLSDPKSEALRIPALKGVIGVDYRDSKMSVAWMDPGGSLRHHSAPDLERLRSMLNGGISSLCAFDIPEAQRAVIGKIRSIQTTPDFTVVQGWAGFLVQHHPDAISPATPDQQTTTIPGTSPYALIKP